MPDLDLPVVRRPTDADLRTAREEVRRRLDRLRRLLDSEAIGVVLERTLELPGLEARLQPQRADGDDTAGARLDDAVRALRQAVPPSLQPAVNDLRAGVDRLGRLVRHAADDGIATASLATLKRHLADPRLRTTPEGEAEVRAAYARAAERLPAEVLEPLGRRLSTPNDVGFVNRSFVTFLARQHLDQPVGFSRQVTTTRISGTGRMTLELSATVPESVGRNRLLVQARGNGTLAATADRRRVHVRATARPAVACTQAVDILPRTIAGDPPEVSASSRTRLGGVGIDGLLGRCRLVQRVAGRALDAALAANDPRVAAALEKTVGERVREEGIALAYRVNGLLRSAVWDQLRAVDYEPAVDLHNDAAGLWSATTYAHAHELAALTPRPNLPADGALDVVRWVHESAVTNSLGGLAGTTIDEATVRGLWEAQFKLSSPAWDALPGGRTPATIRLADDDALALRFVADGVVLDVRATGCEVDGQRVDAGPRRFRIRYRMHDTSSGPELRRDPIEFAGDVPADERPVWGEVLPLFCAREIRPLPRFPNRKARQLFRLAHLRAVDGWLVVGLTRAGSAGDARLQDEASEVRR